MKAISIILSFSFVIISFSLPKLSFCQIFPNPDGNYDEINDETQTIDQCDYKAQTFFLKYKTNTSNRRYKLTLKFNNNVYQSDGAVENAKENCTLVDGCNAGWAKVARIEFYKNGGWDNYKLNVGWRADETQPNYLNLSAYYHEHFDPNTYHVAHKLTSKPVNTEFDVDMFLGNEIIALIIDNEALGIRKPNWYSNETASTLFQTFYYGGPDKKCHNDDYTGVFALNTMKAYFTNQRYDDPDYFDAFNSCDYMTWNLTEFSSEDIARFYAKKEINGSVPNENFVNYESGHPNSDVKQKCVIKMAQLLNFKLVKKFIFIKDFTQKQVPHLKLV